MKGLDRITIDPQIMNGQSTIRGMRVTVRHVLLQRVRGIAGEALAGGAAVRLDERSVRVRDLPVGTAE